MGARTVSRKKSSKCSCAERRVHDGMDIHIFANVLHMCRTRVNLSLRHHGNARRCIITGTPAILATHRTCGTSTFACTSESHAPVTGHVHYLVNEPHLDAVSARSLIHFWTVNVGSCCLLHNWYIHHSRHVDGLCLTHGKSVTPSLTDACGVKTVLRTLENMRPCLPASTGTSPALSVCCACGANTVI